ncbi:unnamed protein product [Owenia fusiformis]|uniref:Uncharacterized protein n=1 Tax=Owenia fusiformis TaxID=6347 RepID=A0A8J1U8B8_OWEFU|nr:unnamed protein product [Owenia fusiformis]
MNQARVHSSQRRVRLETRRKTTQLFQMNKDLTKQCNTAILQLEKDKKLFQRQMTRAQKDILKRQDKLLERQRNIENDNLEKHKATALAKQKRELLDMTRSNLQSAPGGSQEWEKMERGLGERSATTSERGLDSRLDLRLGQNTPGPRRQSIVTRPLLRMPGAPIERAGDRKIHGPSQVSLLFIPGRIT